MPVCPASSNELTVAVWLATIMGKNIDGVRTIEDFWKDYLSIQSMKVDYKHGTNIQSFNA